MDSANMIRCPCIKCVNLCWKVFDDVKYDLFRYGFLNGYEIWNFHGEQYEQVEEETEQPQGNASRFYKERYKSILDERLHTLGGHEEEPEAARPVKKNRCLSEQLVPASDLLHGSDYDKHTTYASSQSTRGRCLSNDLFFKVVRETLQAASSSALSNKTSASREQVKNLAEDVIVGNTSNSKNDFDPQIKEEVTRLVITTLQSIFSSFQRSLKEKENGDQVNASSSLNEAEDV
ncbi:unnamed protein product [Rhodiola kirilowii]